MSFEENIFNKCVFNIEKLLEYGFKKNQGRYYYECYILNGSFKVKIDVEDNNIIGKVIDVEFNEEYNNFRIKDIQGDYVGKVRDEYERVLVNIREKCTTKQLFRYDQSNRIIKEIKNKYDVEPEFLWEDDTAAALRHNDTKKWFGIIMNVSRDKVTKNDKENEIIEVINIKLDDKVIRELLEKEGFYPAYHMNKKSWISIILDNTLKDSYIMQLINNSFNITCDTNTWVIPANPKYYDVVSYIKNNDIFKWHSSKSINKGDIIYIYYGKPYGALLCRGIVLNNDGKEMEIELEKVFTKDEYPIDKLKEWGLSNIRSIRRIPKSVLEFID